MGEVRRAIDTIGYQLRFARHIFLPWPLNRPAPELRLRARERVHAPPGREGTAMTNPRCEASEDLDLGSGVPPTCGGAWPLLGDLPAMRRDPLGLFLRAARAGDVVRLRLGRDVYLLNHPDHIQRVLHENHANYRKNFFYARMKPLLGEGLLTSEGSAWKRKRRLA